MSSSLLFRQCSTCLVRLTWMDFAVVVKWLYSGSFVGYCFQDLSKTARSILVSLLFRFFSLCFICVHVSEVNTVVLTQLQLKKFRFILSDRSDFHMTDNLSIAVHVFAWRMLTSVSVDEILLPKYVNLSTNFRSRTLRVDGSFSFKTHEHRFICVHVEANASCFL